MLSSPWISISISLSCDEIVARVRDDVLGTKGRILAMASSFISRIQGHEQLTLQLWCVSKTQWRNVYMWVG